MKKLFIAIIILVGCRHAPTVPECNVDTLAITAPLEVQIDSLKQFHRVNDIAYKVPDSINTALFLAKYKLERVRFYLNICLKNPSQDKFLKGWIRRAVQ